MESINIVELITNNPITKLSETHNNKFLEKIKNNFTESQQQLFISSFYTYLNYDKTNDFIIDLDNIWKWMGFKHKSKAKILLEKSFTIDNDYKNSLTRAGKQNTDKHNNTNFGSPKSEAKNQGSGGRNIQKYYLNIKTFKSLCLKAQTKKADEIHEYYIKLEELIHDVLEEEATEMKNLLIKKDIELFEKDNVIKNSNQDKYKAIEKSVVSQFPVNTECIYFGTIDNVFENGTKIERLIKFGHSNNLPLRIQDHHKTYNNFILREAFKVHNRQEIENALKAHSKIKGHLRCLDVNGKNKTEILAYDDTNFTIPRLSKYIKDVIHEKTYSIENFNKLLAENISLRDENERINNEIYDLKLEERRKEYEIEKLKQSLKIYHENENIHLENDSQILSQNQSFESDLDNKYDLDPLLKDKFERFINECCILRPDVEVESTIIIAQFRIWNRVKPKKVYFESFNKYLRTRFLVARLQTHNKSVHGFKGIMLNEIKYVKKSLDNDVENFIFENCTFSPNCRTSNVKLLENYISYKKRLGIDITNNEMKELKTYLNSSLYVIGGPIRLHNDNNTYEGYYGIILKTDEENCPRTNGKSVQKIDTKTGQIINCWDSIVNAAKHENISASKMSRNIKRATVYADCYYRVFTI